MFVRWKHYKRSSKKKYIRDGKCGWLDPQGSELLVAVLVRSERVNGKPRQRTVAYLGSIREDHLGEVGLRNRFWESADEKIETLALKAEERQKCEAALLTRVARLTSEENAALLEIQEKARSAASGHSL
jgi:hypothetical protein